MSFGGRRFRGRAVRRIPGFMNKTEAAYGQHLEILKRAGEILEFYFEPLKLRLADKTYYEPDFLVVAKDETIEIHEVKGTMRAKVKDEAGRVVGVRQKPIVEDDAAVKIKACAEKFPFRFKMVWIEGGFWRADEY